MLRHHCYEQSKAGKVDEWKRLPLGSEDQLQAWYSERFEMLKAQRLESHGLVRSVAAENAPGSQTQESQYPEITTTPQISPQNYERPTSASGNAETEELAHQRFQARFDPSIVSHSPNQEQWQQGGDLGDSATVTEQVSTPDRPNNNSNLDPMSNPQSQDVVSRQYTSGHGTPGSPKRPSGPSAQPQPTRLSTVEWEKYF